MSKPTIITHPDVTTACAAITTVLDVLDEMDADGPQDPWNEAAHFYAQRMREKLTTQCHECPKESN